ncbi:PREDICTED: uncharacterized protein LOC104822146 [Tarenaya hassleriana]|uniref:uncharacterized protein LOC104822146 n=1 Tax=Tarenaya hassleriana TaxID=28532 RepID=UPI00053C1C7C|nr:PREDICTED: uncharacterized protein LOC104822146 [Tarenaya hassleriana]
MMQADPLSSQPPAKYAGDDRFPGLFGKLTEDLGFKLKIDGSREEEEEEEERPNLEESVKVHGERDEEEEEEDFSFAFVQSDGSPITAEEAFQNGLIRPVYPLFGQNPEYEQGDYVLVPEDQSLALRLPVRKVFVEDNAGGDRDEDEESTAESSEPQGPFCSWSGKTVAEASPESCRKSNSTGFSRLWRFRDLLLRSSSDGKDAFVFMSSEGAAKDGGRGKKEASAHEKLYVRNRASREEARRRSYLPYKQVGFFANVNGLSRNIHPF